MGLFERKKKNNSAGSFAELFVDALNGALDNAQKITPTLLEEQYVWEPDYGLDKTNPIISDCLNGTEIYLRQLCTSDGKKFTWSKPTTVNASIHGLPETGVDQYTLYLDGKYYTDLFFVTYIGKPEFPPAGLFFLDDKRDWELERRAAKEAYETGSDRETIKRIMKLEAEKEERDSKEAKKENAAEQDISQVYPGVKLDEELKNPLFEALFNLGFAPVMIYEYVHSEQYLTHKKQLGSYEEAIIPSEQYFHKVLLNLYQKELDEINEYKKRDVATVAQELGMPVNVWRSLFEQEVKLQEERWKKREANINEFSKQAVQLKKNYPSFNIEEEVQNDLFVKLLDVVSLREAYEITHFSDCFERNKTALANNNGAFSTPEVPNAKNPGAREISKRFCKNCGHELHMDWAFCNKCGFPVTSQAKGPEDDIEETPNKVEETAMTEMAPFEAAPNLDLSDLPPKLRRAFILVEDEEWEKAESYFESILDEEPENAYAYLGKALIKIKVDSPVNIPEEEIRAICETKSFNRARKYADGDLKKLLDSWLASISK